MEKEIKLPELGEEVEEGDVLKVLVSPGDRIEKEQPILELETDKATVEVPADASGRVKEVRVKEGDRLRVGQVLLVLESEKAEANGETTTARETPETSEAREDEEKAASETRAREPEPEQGAERAETEEEEEAEAEEEGEEPGASRQARETPEKRSRKHEQARPSRSAPVPAAPSVRRLARELGVDISQVSGSGRGGRISPDDVKAYARAVVMSAGGIGERPSLPDFGKWGAVETERLSALRRAAARALARAWTQIPHVTHHDRADITETEDVRRQYADRIEDLGGKLTVTALVIHVVAVALQRFPQFNASIDVRNEQVVYKDYCHIGVAVDTERGLVVPVLRNADRMSLAEIAVSLTAIAERAREGKLAREDMEGSSFTVTNLGGIGGTSFTPIVQWPEVAVLGISRSRTEALYRNGTIEPRLVLPLSLSYDHRLIDGADAARFLRFVVEALEHPLLMSLGVSRP